MTAARWLALALALAACATSPESEPPPTSSAADAQPSATARPAATHAPEPRLDPNELAGLADRAPPLVAHLEALQAIADARPGRNRATGTAGFDGSVDYVTGVLRTAGYEVDERPFTIDSTSSVNLLAERAGTGDGVVMIGAHLDSVPAGPGINDNASGVAALLVIAEGLVRLPPPERTIRIAFWGAEEGGAFGSRAYVDSLSSSVRGEIVAYLNLDMLASPNAVNFVYDEAGAAPGSDAITRAFGSRLERAGITWDRIDLEGDSDHGPFTDAGVPTGGVFSGGIEPVTARQAARAGSVAGEPADPCSHRACDTIDNVDVRTLASLTRAVAGVVADLADPG